MPSYVIVTESAKEPKVVAKLADCGIDAYCPTERRKVFTGRHATIRERAIFPRYVFVSTEQLDRDFAAIRHAPHVTAFLGQNNRPRPVDDAWLAHLLLIQTFGGFDYAAVRKPRYRVGQAIRLIAGPFQGYLGVITAFDDRRAWFDTVRGPMSARREHLAA
jgi:transcriptional antiterminator NusG